MAKKVNKNTSRWVMIGITAILCITAIIVTLTSVKSYQNESDSFIAKLHSILAVGKEKTEILSSEAIYEGVYIENIHVGGLTKEQAFEKVQSLVSETISSPYIKMTFKDKTWSLSGEDLGAQSNIDKAINDAFNVGRTGTRENRLAEIEDIKTNNRHISITVLPNSSVISTTVAKIKSEIDTKPTNATVSFSYNSQSKKPEFKYTADKIGYDLNAETAVNEILVAFHQSSQVTYDLKPTVLEADIKLADIQHEYVMISKFSTKTNRGSSKTDVGRRTNIKISSAAFNNYVWMPGDVLSFNQTTGKRTAEKGYEAGLFITSDRVYDEITGGGVCQTSTTLFNAALLAGATEIGKGGIIEITRRYPHSWPSTYVKPGFDASVNWPSADLIMRNNRSTPIFIRTYFENYTVTFEMWGLPLEDQAQYSIEQVLIETTPAPAQEMVIDTAKKYVTKPGQSKVVSKSREGYVYEAYQIKTTPNQEPVRTLLYKTVYNPIPGKTYYLPAE